MATTIKMPQLGESVTEGTIERWLVKEGDTVEQYDPLFEVVTDKVNAEVPAEVAGTITKIIVPRRRDGEGRHAAGRDRGRWRRRSRGSSRGRRPPPRHPPSRRRQPRLRHAPEAAADAGTPAVEEPAQPAAASRGRPGTRAAARARARRSRRQPPAAPAEAPAAAPNAAAATANGAARMTPAVRRLVREHDIDITQLRGSGAGGRVTRDDVLAFIDKAPAAAQRERARRHRLRPDGTGRLPPPRRRARAARPAAAAAPRCHAPTPPSVPPPPAATSRCRCRRCARASRPKMTRVKQTVPHAYTVVEVDMHNVVRWREANTWRYKAREGIGSATSPPSSRP